MAFNDRQKVFIAAYVACRNATKAAIEAGYSEKAANEHGSRLLANASIRGEIERRLGDVIDRYAVTSDRIIRELAKIGFSNVDDFVAKQDDGSVIVDFSTATREQMAGLTSIEVEEYTEGRGNDARGVKRVKFKLGEKKAALMDLAKIARMLPAERFEHTGANGGPMQMQPVGEIIDIAQLEPEQREQFKQILFAAKRLKAPVTDVEDESDDA